MWFSSQSWSFELWLLIITQCPLPSTQYPVLPTQYSVLSNLVECTVLPSTCSMWKIWCHVKECVCVCARAHMFNLLPYWITLLPCTFRISIHVIPKIVFSSVTNVSVHLFYHVYLNILKWFITKYYKHNVLQHSIQEYLLKKKEKKYEWKSKDDKIEWAVMKPNVLWG